MTRNEFLRSLRALVQYHRSCGVAHYRNSASLRAALGNLDGLIEKSHQALSPGPPAARTKAAQPIAALQAGGQIHALTELAGEIGRCTNCPLHQSRRVSTAGFGGLQPKLLVIGDWLCHTDEHLEVARHKGIVVNAIQSGQHQHTRPAWQQIAALGQGEYFQVEDSGNTIAVATPFDEELSTLAAELEATRLYFGDAEAKKAHQAKLDANARLRRELSSEALARRDTFNATASGKANLLGDSELVEAVTSGRVELDEIEAQNLPSSLQALAPAEQREVIDTTAKRRNELQQQIRQLSDSRSRYLKQKVEAAGGADDSLDEKIYSAVKEQAASSGLTYDSDSASY